MTANAIADGLFTIDGNGTVTLIGGYSPTSNAFHFPLLTVCPYSGADDVERVELTRDATLWGWTAVTAAPPGYHGPVPYGFGVVELTHERLRIITRITESDPARLEFGQPMSLGTETLPDADGNESVIWTFTPTARAAS